MLLSKMIFFWTISNCHWTMWGLCALKEPTRGTVRRFCCSHKTQVNLSRRFELYIFLVCTYVVLTTTELQSKFKWVRKIKRIKLRWELNLLNGEKITIVCSTMSFSKTYCQTEVLFKDIVCLSASVSYLY